MRSREQRVNDQRSSEAPAAPLSPCGEGAGVGRGQRIHRAWQRWKALLSLVGAALILVMEGGACWL